MRHSKDMFYLSVGCDQYLDIPAANRNIHMVRTNGNVSVGSPTGARKLASPAWHTTVRMPASIASAALFPLGSRKTQPTAIMVSTGLNPYKPISIAFRFAPRSMGTTIPITAPPAAISAPRNETIAMPVKNRRPTIILSANMTSLTPFVSAVNQTSIGTAPAPVTAEGTPGAGKTGPRTKASNAYTATRNIQQVSTNGDVEAGIL